MEQLQIGARKPLFFMHIPKTAGMSMRLYLSGQYRAEDVCPAVRWHGLLGREDELKRYRLVQGHFRYNLRELLAPEARMLVMLREPLRRTVSALRHLQRDPSFHLDHERAKGLTLSAMLRHSQLMQNQHNVQARFLCASRPAAEVSAYLRGELEQNPAADAGDREAPPTLELAKERLASIDFVGLTEDIDAIVAVMAREMDYHPALYFPLINADPSRENPLDGLSEADLAIVREHNAVDLELYAFARRLIEQRKFQSGMRELVKRGAYRVPAGSFEIPLGGIMPGSGWYAPEQDGDVAWRWTGPGRYFTIEVPLRADLSYRLRVRFGCARALDEAGFTAEVNDETVDSVLLRDGKSYRYECRVPQALLARSDGFCRVRFDTREAVQASADDLRSLGVAVRRIEFECLE
jgi:hypothetical protein